MNFMGSNLHICYTPECENLDDLREKFNERRIVVQRKSAMNEYLKGKQRSMNIIRRKQIKKPCKTFEKQPTLIRKSDPISSTTESTSQSFERTTNEIRAKIRDVVNKSNLIPLALQQEIKKKKRLQI